jgi:small subunit ribosomal protein S2
MADACMEGAASAKDAPVEPKSNKVPEVELPAGSAEPESVDTDEEV